MTYEMYRALCLGSTIACGVMTVASAILFFVLRIPRVISDLTGRTARKAIEDIRRQNEQSGDKTYRSSAVNQKRGKLTDKISPSGRIIARGSSPFGTGTITEKIFVQPSYTDPSNNTTILEQGEYTTVLSPESGSTGSNTENAAGSSLCSETTILQQEEEQNCPRFSIEYEITFVHTNEVIS